MQSQRPVLFLLPSFDLETCRAVSARLPNFTSYLRISHHLSISLFHIRSSLAAYQLPTAVVDYNSVSAWAGQLCHLSNDDSYRFPLKKLRAIFVGYIQIPPSPTQINVNVRHLTYSRRVQRISGLGSRLSASGGHKRTRSKPELNASGDHEKKDIGTSYLCDSRRLFLCVECFHVCHTACLLLRLRRYIIA